jgi:hypothetical protein
VANAAARCQAAVLIGPDEAGALAQLPKGLPVLRARLVAGPEAAALAGQPVFAFCGIANPAKFFGTLQEAGAVLAGRESFADHYPYDDGDLRDLLAQADALRAVPVTTRKDFVRIPPAYRARVTVVSVALAWEEAGEAGWSGLSDEIAGLALGAFIDHRGVLSEFFDADWRRADGDDGRLVEPGHQFEWAWLLDRWGRARGRADGQLAARALHEAGRQGVDPRRACAVNALWQDLTVRDGWARLWPQTEFLKSALALGETEDALQAAAGLRRYLDTPVRGLWRDRQGPTGGFAPGDAPATSLYHIVGAIRQLEELSPALSA